MSEETKDSSTKTDESVEKKQKDSSRLDHVPGKPGSVVRQGSKGMVTPGTVPSPKPS